MIAFVNTSYVGDLLLKVLMCGLPEYQSGQGLTPFWKTDPYSACKRKFLFFSWFMYVYLAVVAAKF